LTAYDSAMREPTIQPENGQPAPHSGVQTVERAFGLLEVLAAEGGELTLTALAERTGLPMPTIHRLLQTLAAAGYVAQRASRRYALGPRLIWLGEGAVRLMSGWVRPHLQSLVDTLDETANLAMLDGDRAVYVAQVPSGHSMRMFTEVGRRVHLHSTGVGKALLSTMTPEQAALVVTRTGLPPVTEQTITDPSALLAELATVRHRGYAIDDGEQEVGVRCVAAAVPGAPAPMAISVSGPNGRMTDAALERAATVLRRTTELLTEALGGQLTPTNR